VVVNCDLGIGIEEAMGGCCSCKKKVYRAAWAGTGYGRWCIFNANNKIVAAFGGGPEQLIYYMALKAKAGWMFQPVNSSPELDAIADATFYGEV
jgi:hypothetical protein